MDLVDAQPGECDERARLVQRLGVLAEDVSDRTLGESDLVGNADEGAPQGSALHVARQAPGRGVPFVHGRQRLEEGAATSAAAVPLAYDAQGNLLAVDRQIQKQGMLRAEPLEFARHPTAEARSG
jgi:hypothetical protein